jgi:hypothetical protein
VWAGAEPIWEATSMCFWVSSVVLLSLSFLLCQMGLITLMPSSEGSGSPNETYLLPYPVLPVAVLVLSFGD